MRVGMPASAEKSVLFPVRDYRSSDVMFISVSSACCFVVSRVVVEDITYPNVSQEKESQVATTTRLASFRRIDKR